MTGIKFLGAGGSVGSDTSTTCIQITKNTLIDAGNILHSLGEEAQYINNIFISHSHLDHIVDTAFLLDSFFQKRTQTLKIYALPQTIEALKQHIYNNIIWPDFSKINMLNSNEASAKFIPMIIGKKYKIEHNISLTPFASKHSVPCCGFIIEKGDNALLYSADTFKNTKIWEHINTHANIKALIIDVSFPNELASVARASKHLTAKFLQEDIQNLQRDDVKIYVNHLKPLFKKQIIEELLEIGLKESCVVNDGDIIKYEDGSIMQSFDNLHDKIEKLINIGTALSSEEDIETILENIVTETKNITHADGGTLYLLEKNKLHFKIVQTDTLNINMGAKNEKITWSPLPMYLKNGNLNKEMVAVVCALEDRVINIPDVYKAEGFSFDGTKKFDKSTGYRSQSMLVIPLKNHEHRVIGVLQLINKKNYLSDKITIFTQEDEDVTLSLASQAAIAITKVKLIEKLEKLLEAFLKSIIFAIGKKSPHTAGHIERMVQLSLMLANGINKDNEIFKDVHYTKEHLQEINFAALMHDIGKLATPEQIVNKATKLETIYDRIYIIEMRIALIKKEFEIAYLKNKIDKREFEEKVLELDEYFGVIQKSNTNSSFTSEEDVTLFTTLANKIYRINDKSYKVLAKDEAYNLSVRKGTLTNEERQIINDHAKISLEILEKLPFPQKYKNIPEISGSHHEKINGKGYPRKLKGDEISLEARILAIADIFEALTASDRPYKEANSLHTSMKILYAMAKDNELDKKLVKYFYTSGLYKKYAKKFLSSNLIDNVDIDFDCL